MNSNRRFISGSLLLFVVSTEAQLDPGQSPAAGPTGKGSLTETGAEQATVEPVKDHNEERIEITDTHLGSGFSSCQCSESSRGTSTAVVHDVLELLKELKEVAPHLFRTLLEGANISKVSLQFAVSKAGQKLACAFEKYGIEAVINANFQLPNSKSVSL